MEWEKCNKSIVYPHASCFYQARIFKKGEDDIYADIVQYDCIGNLPQSWELDIQIPEGFSITGKTINVKSFIYAKLDYKRMEKDAKKLIKALIK